MKTLLSIPLIFLSIHSLSQINLQLSNAILLNSSAVVPEGTVWKIESTLNGNSNSSIFQSTISDCVMSIFINNKEICINKHQSYAVGSCCSPAAAASESFQQVSVLPFWLPEGSTIRPGFNCEFISILEFQTIEIE
jgi:hypothetical protein